MAKNGRKSGLGLSVTLWVLTFVCVSGAVVYQRMTGPTKPLRGSVVLRDDVEVPYKLVRSENTDRDAAVTLPEHPELSSAILYYRRHGTDEPFVIVPMVRTEGSGWAASLPAQPAAGKLDYHLILTSSAGVHRVPAEAGQNVVIRFKDPVPATVLIPHVIMMFLSLWIGLRAGVAALFEPAKARRLAWITLGALSLGGLLLGPIVQKYAFGAYWTGWPVGEDLTDTKTLVMWGGWLFAVIVLGLRRKLTWKRRGAVLLATAIMIGVYLVPHSLRGSTLDYTKLDEGVPAKDAIGTG